MTTSKQDQRKPATGEESRRVIKPSTSHSRPHSRARSPKVQQMDGRASGMVQQPDPWQEQLVAFQLMFQNNPLPMWFFDPATLKFIEVNRAAVLHYGYTREEFLRMRISDIRPVAQVPSLMRHLDTLDDDTEGQFDGQHMKKNGELIDVYVTGLTLDLNGHRMRFVLAQDITERKRAERALKRYAASQLQLLQQLAQVEEAERRRLSREIHDGPLQSLGVSLMALDRSRARRERGEEDLADIELQTLKASLRGTVAELRSILADLSIEVLGNQGLREALTGYIERFSEITGLDVSLSYSVATEPSDNLQLLLYRLTQEALSNTRKHADATRVEISIEKMEDQMLLIIADNGRGFDLPHVMTRRREDGRKVGLRSMHERIVGIGGSMKIKSAAGRGTTLEISCPISEREDDQYQEQLGRFPSDTQPLDDLQ